MPSDRELVDVQSKTRSLTKLLDDNFHLRLSQSKLVLLYTYIEFMSDHPISVISAEEFKQKTFASFNKQEKKYQDKLLNAGPVFSQKNKNLALQYCHSYHKNHQVCLVVDSQHYLQVWYEENQLSSPIETKPKSKNNRDINHDHNLQYPLLIDSTFVDHCQQILVELIGPMATIICKRAATQNPHIEQSQFIELVAKQVPDPVKVEEFKQKLLD